MARSGLTESLIGKLCYVDPMINWVLVPFKILYKTTSAVKGTDIIALALRISPHV